VKKRLLVLALLLIIAGTAAAQEFAPNTVKAMDVTVTLGASGKIIGEKSQTDTATIKMLVPAQTETQEIAEKSERLESGGNSFEPTHETSEGKSFAVWELPLKQLDASGDFKITVKARIKTKALFELGNDYNLLQKVQGQDKFLQQTTYIESDDAELKTKAGMEFTSSSELETIRQITEWVKNNITYDFENYYNGIWSAKDTYKNRAGVCDEFANLTAAFLRIKGIPTKYVIGISFDGKLFGNHGWNKAFINGKWIGVDSTYGEAGYLDATHISLGELADATEQSSIQIKTVSSSELKAEMSLDEPIVEINSIEYFDGLTEASIEKPERLASEENFSIKAKIKNKQNSNIIMPAELILFEGFEYQNRERLELFKPLEEKTIEWKAKAPKATDPNKYTVYEMLLALPDKKIKSELALYPKEAAQQKKSEIRIIDVSPFIEQKQLRIQITLQNNGGEAGGVTVTIKQRQSVKATDIVPAKSQKKLEYVLQEFSAGELKILVETDETKEFSAIIPEEKSGAKIEVTETTTATQTQQGQGTQTQGQQGTQKEKGFFEKLIEAIMALFASLFGAPAK
jgi:hypothetical protein